MIVGTPKEIKNHEYRVGLTPESVFELVAHGHQVLVETGAGTEAADAHLKSRGLIVRRVGGYGLPGHLRISIGDEAGCRAVAGALRDFGAGS